MLPPCCLLLLLCTVIREPFVRPERAPPQPNPSPGRTYRAVHPPTPACITGGGLSPGRQEGRMALAGRLQQPGVLVSAPAAAAKDLARAARRCAAQARQRLESATAAAAARGAHRLDHRHRLDVPACCSRKHNEHVESGASAPDIKFSFDRAAITFCAQVPGGRQHAPSSGVGLAAGAKQQARGTACYAGGWSDRAAFAIASWR